jgi:hypothetical protein
LPDCCLVAWSDFSDSDSPASLWGWVVFVWRV